MSNILVAERALDITPLIEALKFQPEDFELSKGWLSHVPSRHRYRFDRRGQVTIDAHCGCALLAARRDQEADLAAAFARWRADYWSAVEINRDFASHFAPIGRWRRFVRDLRMALRRLRRKPADVPVAMPFPAPAE